MKKRLLAMALATTMLVTSFNVVYAQDADVATGETTVESSETSPSDATVSGVAVTNGEDAVATTSEDGKYGIVDGETWPTTSPWKATVFGSVGTQERIDNPISMHSTAIRRGWQR